MKHLIVFPILCVILGSCGRFGNSDSADGQSERIVCETGSHKTSLPDGRANPESEWYRTAHFKSLKPAINLYFNRVKKGSESLIRLLLNQMV